MCDPAVMLLKRQKVVIRADGVDVAEVYRFVGDPLLWVPSVVPWQAVSETEVQPTGHPELAVVLSVACWLVAFRSAKGRDVRRASRKPRSGVATWVIPGKVTDIECTARPFAERKATLTRAAKQIRYRPRTPDSVKITPHALRISVGRLSLRERW